MALMPTTKRPLDPNAMAPLPTATTMAEPPMAPLAPMATSSPSQPQAAGQSSYVPPFTQPATSVGPGQLQLGPFTPAPSSTPFGNFTAPNPADVANDPYYQFRQQEGQRGIEHSAAAKGTLLSGGALKSLARFNSGLASEEAGKAFDRAMETYNANRGTNAQNFGQQMDTYGANTNAGNAYGRLGLDTAGFNADQQQVEQQRADEEYQRQVAETRRQNEEASAFARLPVAKTPSPWRGAEFR